MYTPRRRLPLGDVTVPAVCFEQHNARLLGAVLGSVAQLPVHEDREERFVFLRQTLRLKLSILVMSDGILTVCKGAQKICSP